ncbi:QDE2-like protein [Metarhizium brunneum]
MDQIMTSLAIQQVARGDHKLRRLVGAFAKFFPRAKVWVTFTIGNGTKVRRKNRFITVHDYYRKKYGMNLQDYPVLNLGTSKRPTFFPAEAIEIQPGQSVKAMLTGEETTAMLAFACRTLDENALSISSDARKVLDYDDNATLQNRGLGLGLKGKAPPSLVGLVASVDQDLAQWPAMAWEQKSKQEMLGSTLTDAFKSRLSLWRSNNKTLPENIVIFCDGVSEGQFAQVVDQELPMIRDACRQTYPPGKQPKLSIIVSVKRHQTRFYPTNTEDMSRSGNVKNGTVVDRGITLAPYWDFFLTAHEALQGKARPAHYTVLLDEVFRYKYGERASSELERLTHELCYLFGRATKAVSICPPAYYADIVCERARAQRPEYDVSDVESECRDLCVEGVIGCGGGEAGSQVVRGFHVLYLIRLEISRDVGMRWIEGRGKMDDKSSTNEILAVLRRLF